MRAEFLAMYDGTTKADVAFALKAAATPDEVTAAAHLSLLLFGVAGTQARFTEHSRIWPPLHDLVVAARTRVEGYPEARYAAIARAEAQTAAAREAAIARRREIRAENEARIARLGITNAKPGRTARTHRGA